MASIWVIHGPNLNLLGRREPALYGHGTLQDIDRSLVELARSSGHLLSSFQSNHEGDLVTWIQEAAEEADLLLLNPGGYTHSSVALRDALIACSIPTVEVHITNTNAREPFRRQSLIADVVQARVMGFGPASYEVALRGGLILLEQGSSGSEEAEA